MTEGHNRSNLLTETLSNRPFVVGLFFIGTYFVPFLILIGVALAYVFKQNIEEEWEASHFEYLIRTFWIGLTGIILSALVALFVAAALDAANVFSKNDSAMIVFFGVAVTLAVVGLVFCGIRIVISLMKSASAKPMPNPKSWLL